MSKHSYIQLLNRHLLHAYYVHDTLQSKGRCNLVGETLRNQDYMTRASYRKLQSTKDHLTQLGHHVRTRLHAEQKDHSANISDGSPRQG